MSKVTTSVTTTVTKTVKLLPSLRRQLLVEITAAQKAKLAMDAAEATYNKKKAKIRELRERAGVESLEIDGHTTSNVTGVMTKFDEKKMLVHGLSIAEIESFKTTTPKKPYEKVTFASTKVAKRLLEDGDYSAE
jgi:hypothetical protein